jgi:hypothetical protein
MLQQKQCVVIVVSVCVSLLCFFVQVHHVSGVKKTTVYVTRDENGVRFTYRKNGNDTIWLAKGHYAPRNNETG